MPRLSWMEVRGLMITCSWSRINSGEAGILGVTPQVLRQGFPGVDAFLHRRRVGRKSLKQFSQQALITEAKENTFRRSLPEHPY